MRISIAQDVFEKAPGYRRGLVIAHGIQNGPSQAELIQELRAAESQLRTELDPDNFISHPKIAAWREAYRALGIKPGEFRPSMDALVRRVLKNDPLPAINRIVDIGNLVSIRNIVPIGAHAIDLLKQDMELRLASGSESFEPFGSEAFEHPNPAEIIFAEGQTVLTRRWTWRQAKQTLVLDSSSAVEINVDALPPVTDEEIGRICAQLCALVSQYCGGEMQTAILSAENPGVEM